MDMFDVLRPEIIFRSGLQQHELVLICATGAAKAPIFFHSLSPGCTLRFTLCAIFYALGVVLYALHFLVRERKRALYNALCPSDTLHKITRSPESNSPESPAPTSAHLDETQLYPLLPSCCTTIRIAVTCAGASEVAIYLTFTVDSLWCPSNCQTSLGEHLPGSAF